jgi:hypothetical protein
MSMPASTALTNSTTNQTAIQTAADTSFISSVDAQINTAINLGQFEITAVTNSNINISNIFNYYAGLGYYVSFPDYMQQNGAQIPSLFQQPTNFFGYNWIQYWQNYIGALSIKNPTRITIAWIPPHTHRYDPV